MLFFWTFYSSKKPENKLYSVLLLYCFQHNNNNNNNIKCFFFQNIFRMISEGSCDTEDWSNDAKKSALKSQELIQF